METILKSRCTCRQPGEMPLPECKKCGGKGYTETIKGYYRTPKMPGVDPSAGQPNMVSLRKLAGTNTLVLQHLQAWEHGLRFPSFEAMLISLVHKLATRPAEVMQAYARECVEKFSAGGLMSMPGGMEFTSLGRDGLYHRVSAIGLEEVSTDGKTWYPPMGQMAEIGILDSERIERQRAADEIETKAQVSYAKEVPILDLLGDGTPVPTVELMPEIS